MKKALAFLFSLIMCDPLHMMFLFSFLTTLNFSDIRSAHAQVCNPPSGWVVQNGNIIVGNNLVYGPNCGEMRDGGAPIVPFVFGFARAYYNGTSWAVQKPDGTFVNTSSTTSCGLQELVSLMTQYSVMYFGQGTTVPCNLSNTAPSITIPAQYGNSFYGFGMNFTFNNGSAIGLIFDTQRDGIFSCLGCLWYENSPTIPIYIAPSHGPGGISCTSNSTACWAVDYEYDIGYVSGMAGMTGQALVAVDVSLGNGSNQLLSSTIGTNIFRFAVITNGAGASQYDIRLISPSNAFQAGGENHYWFNDLEGASVANILIGGSSINDPNLGTNYWNGNIAQTGTSAGSNGIQSNSFGDLFDLVALNAYQVIGSQVNVQWNTNATMNTIRTQQLLAAGGGIMSDASTSKTNNIFLLPNHTTPIPRQVSGLPTCVAALEGWTYIVTDNNTAAAWNAGVTSGGAIKSAVKCDGTSWKQF